MEVTRDKTDTYRVLMEDVSGCRRRYYIVTLVWRKTGTGAYVPVFYDGRPQFTKSPGTMNQNVELWPAALWANALPL